MGGILEGKVCLITGCAQGIGRAMAELFCNEGATVYANDLEVNRAKLEEIAAASSVTVQEETLTEPEEKMGEDGIGAVQEHVPQDILPLGEKVQGIAALNSEKAARNSEKAMQHSMKAMQDSEKAMQRSMRAAANYRGMNKDGLPADAETDSLRYLGGRIIPIIFDITDASAAKEAVQKIRYKEGRLDVLVNNAGIAYNEAIGLISPEHVARMFEVNVFAAMELMQLSARVMRRQRNGSIINISSMVGVNGDKGQTAYSASKGAIIAMTKSAAKELAQYNIRVNSIAPGLTDTPLFHATDTQKLEERIKSIGFGRIANPEDVAEACAFLASDRASYITGQVLGVDGGT